MLDNDVIVPVVMFIALAMMFLGIARVISDTIIRRRFFQVFFHPIFYNFSDQRQWKLFIKRKL